VVGQVKPSITPSTDDLRPRSSGSAGVEEARSALWSTTPRAPPPRKPAGKELAESLSWQHVEASADRERQADAHRRRHPGVDSSHWRTEHETAGSLASLQPRLKCSTPSGNASSRLRLAGHQLELSEQDAKTRLYRSFEPAVVPGLLSDRRVCSRALLTGRSRCTSAQRRQRGRGPPDAAQRCCTARIKPSTSSSRGTRATACARSMSCRPA